MRARPILLTKGPDETPGPEITGDSFRDYSGDLPTTNDPSSLTKKVSAIVPPASTPHRYWRVLCIHVRLLNEYGYPIQLPTVNPTVGGCVLGDEIKFDHTSDIAKSMPVRRQGMKTSFVPMKRSKKQAAWRKADACFGRLFFGRSR
jgi:hypothetical protein